MKTSEAQREVIERADWMRLARRQSRALAGSREGLQVPLRWDAGQEARGRASRRPLRLSWAMLLLPALIFGGATGTWAFVRHLRLQEPTAPATTKPSMSPLPTPPEKSQARQTGRPAPRPAPAVIVKNDPPPRRAPRKAARVKRAAAPPAAPPAAAATGPAIVVPTRVVGEDQVIIVSPPAKMTPLWSVESYKKRRGRATMPGR